VGFDGEEWNTNEALGKERSSSESPVTPTICSCAVSVWESEKVLGWFRRWCKEVVGVSKKKEPVEKLLCGGDWGRGGSWRRRNVISLSVPALIDAIETIRACDLYDLCCYI